MKYYLIDGTEVSRAQIKSAFEKSDAVIVHGHGEGKTTSGLMLDGKQWDARGECYSIWEETWTREPTSLAEALRIAGVEEEADVEYAVGFYSATDKRYYRIDDSTPGSFGSAMTLAKRRNAIPTQRAHHAVMTYPGWIKFNDALPSGKSLDDFMDHP